MTSTICCRLVALCFVIFPLGCRVAKQNPGRLLIFSSEGELTSRQIDDTDFDAGRISSIHLAVIEPKGIHGFCRRLQEIFFVDSQGKIIRRSSEEQPVFHVEGAQSEEVIGQRISIDPTGRYLAFIVGKFSAWMGFSVYGKLHVFDLKNKVDKVILDRVIDLGGISFYKGDLICCLDAEPGDKLYQSAKKMLGPASRPSAPEGVIVRVNLDTKSVTPIAWGEQSVLEAGGERVLIFREGFKRGFIDSLSLETGSTKTVFGFNELGPFGFFLIGQDGQGGILYAAWQVSIGEIAVFRQLPGQAEQTKSMVEVPIGTTFSIEVGNAGN